MEGSEIMAVPPPGKVRDGHSIVFVGYEDDPKKPGGGAFIFRNSNGPKWGREGCGLMSYAYVRAYANDALWLHFGPPDSEKPIERFEAKSMPIVGHGHCEAAPQDMREYEAPLWSRGSQLYCNAEDGGFVELALAVPSAGRYRLRVLGTAAPDYGLVRITLEGKGIERVFSLYSGRVCPAGSLELGTVDLTAGRHKIRFTSVGKPPGSTGFAFGLDAIDLLPPL
jgi:hypothetical protein